MSEKQVIVISAQRAGMRVDAALAETLLRTRSFIAGLIQQGCVRCDGTVVEKAGKKVKEGDVFEVLVPEVRAMDMKPEKIPLSILYQDEDIAVINKPRGMVVHPSNGNETGTLVNACLYHLDHLSGIGGVERPGIVHRLDKDTTGILVVAKNDIAHESLSRQLQERKVCRIYLALVHGRVREEGGMIDAPIGRHPTDRKKMAVREDGRTARTHFRVAGQLVNQTLLFCRLETGRTHQIRVHLKYRGYPVVGDAVYGTRKETGTGQLLHGICLGFSHPQTKEEMTFTAPPPDDFLRALKGAGGSYTEKELMAWAKRSFNP